MGYEQTVNMFQGLADLTQDKFGAPKSWAFVESFYYIIQRTSSKFTGNKTKRKKETIIGIFFDKWTFLQTYINSGSFSLVQK